MHHHHKRAETVVWVTDWVTTYETVDITTTVWVSEGYVPPSTTSPSSTLSTARSTAEIPDQFFEGGNQQASSSSSSSSSIYVAPAPTSTYVPPTSSIAPAPSPTSEAAVDVAPAPVSTSAAETPTEAAVPAPVSSSSSSSGSSTGVCPSDSPCGGDITYYTAGLGACGVTTDGDVVRGVALPYELMGTLSNTNPYCGKTISITCTATGKSTNATVIDKCMGCHGYSIDLTNAAFEELDDLSVGRTLATWFFTD